MKCAKVCGRQNIVRNCAENGKLCDIALTTLECCLCLKVCKRDLTNQTMNTTYYSLETACPPTALVFEIFDAPCFYILHNNNMRNYDFSSERSKINILMYLTTIK
jgi:hypothetical protein